MNRNILKIIAFVTMIIDHIGAVFFPNIIVFRIIGRIAFPIFAFFVAEGFYYTKSRKKYVFTLILFILISWAPFCLALENPFYTSNVLGVFLLSVLGMYLFEKLFKYKQNWVLWGSIICVYFVGVLVLHALGIIPEGFFGVLLPIVFFIFRERKIWKLSLASIVLVLMSSLFLIDGVSSIFDFVQFFSLFAIILIAFYNENKGRLNLKYLFYIGYPVHLFILYLLSIVF